MEDARSHGDATAVSKLLDERQLSWGHWLKTTFPQVERELLARESTITWGDQKLITPLKPPPDAAQLARATEVYERRHSQCLWKVVHQDSAEWNAIIADSQRCDSDAKPALERALSKTNRLMQKPLLFAPGSRLLSIPHKDHEFRIVLGPDGANSSRRLNGQSQPIHEWNARRSRATGAAAVDCQAPDVAEEYLRFFTHHLSADDRIFFVVESLKEIRFSGAEGDHDEVLEFHADPRVGEQTFKEEIGMRLFPIVRLEATAEETTFCACMIFAERLAHCVLVVRPGGMVDLPENKDFLVRLGVLGTSILPLVPRLRLR
jgi:hypothetical protein